MKITDQVVVRSRRSRHVGPESRRARPSIAR